MSQKPLSDAAKARRAPTAVRDSSERGATSAQLRADIDAD